MAGDRRQPHGATVNYAELGKRVLEAAPVVLVALDAEGAIQYVNAYFERLTGYSLDEVQGKDWFETFLPRRDHARVRARFSRCLAGERVHDNVNPILTRAGEERQIEWTPEVLRDDDGRATVLAIGHDVTDHVAAREALEASQQGLAEAQRIARLGAWKLDLRTQTAWMSDEQCLLSGFPTGTIVAMDDYMKRIHPDDRTAFAKEVAHALTAGGGELEYRIVLPNGEVRDIHGRAKTTYDERGEPVGMIGTTQDITERKRTEESARRASDAPAHRGGQGAVRDVPARPRRRVPGLGRSRARQARLQTRRGGRPIGAGDVRGCAGLPRGVSPGARRGADRVRVARRRLRVRGDLRAERRRPGAHRWRHRRGHRHHRPDARRGTAACRRRGAEPARGGGLREADRRKNDFIAVMSHELRNPLSAIQHGLYLLDRVGPDNERERRAIDILQRQVTQLTRLVDDLLDVSRITQNKIRLQRARSTSISWSARWSMITGNCSRATA